MIKVSDYIVKRLEEYGIKHIFMISGGGAMHLNDSIGKSEKISYICNHHEQASAIGAEGYSKVSGKLGVVCVTTGPGGINTLNGVFGQWTDSVPVLYISGQVKHETTIHSCPEINLRQLGDQEVDVVSIVSPITKYAKMLTDPYEIGMVLDKAIYTATHDRPGPVWIDIPMNVQGALIDESKLVKYSPEKDKIQVNYSRLQSDTDFIVRLLNKSGRPVIVAGNGINISGTKKEFKNIIKLLNIPVVTTFNGFDLLHNDHPLFIGRIGTVGQRAGNFALQNADLVLFLGTRNNIRQVSYNWQTSTADAERIVVDIDPSELLKPTIKPGIPICADLKDFFNAFSTSLNKYEKNNTEWIKWCQERKSKYDPGINPEYLKNSGKINLYYFMLKLTELMPEKTVAVTGNGSACVGMFQAGICKKNQRIFWNSGDASMGYDLPAAIGACIANNGRDVICLAGDGSLMMNIQELQTVKHYNLPIKLFILNNDGYISIRQTQNNFFKGRLTACSKDTGVSMPDFIKVAQAFDLPVKRIEDQESLKLELEKVLNTKGPVICEIMLDDNYIFTPKLSSEKLPDGKMISKPLEDMYPFLDRDEFKSNMIIK